MGKKAINGSMTILESGTSDIPLAGVCYGDSAEKCRACDAHHVILAGLKAGVSREESR
jgi:hypothetical protein